MTGDVVGLERRGAQSPAPVTDFWFARLDRRLGRIEAAVARIERQMWLALWTAVALLAAQTVRAMAGM